MAIKSVKKRRKRVAFWLLFCLAVLWMLPLLWAIGTSFKSTTEITTNVINIIPHSPTLENYIALFAHTDMYPIFDWLRNSAFISIIHTLLYLSVASLAGYGFGVMKWKYRNFVFGLLLGTMMIPAVVNLIPLFSMVINFGWLDNGPASMLALILPGLGGVFGLFIIRQFFLNIPTEVIESAKIDGLGHFGIYLRIVLPLGKSALMVAGLFAFMGTWNDYLWPSITAAVVRDPNFYTLQTGLATMQGANNYNYGEIMAAAVISIVPVLIVYMLVQDKIIEGISHTGIK
ncbi:MAG TPA: carbohydrate ABC transporter permease [Firmicutes bacterium]|jgi:multiple sugar transport system permease protein|nr:carbohydrate ABC transporter permease [Bacillota bacterium]